MSNFRLSTFVEPLAPQRFKRHLFVFGDARHNLVCDFTQAGAIVFERERHGLRALASISLSDAQRSNRVVVFQLNFRRQSPALPIVDALLPVLAASNAEQTSEGGIAPGCLD